MSEGVQAVIDEWVSENIHPTGYIAEDDRETARKLASQCKAEITAKHPAIKEFHINECVGDLADYLERQIERVNDAEVSRLAERDD